MIDEARLLRTGMVLVLTAVMLVALLLAGCGDASSGGLSPREILSRAVAGLLALKSYRYLGTSSLSVSGDPRLSSSARFETFLEQNDSGGLDGHMVVKSPSYSYETYSYRGVEYTRVEGEDWVRVDRKADPGYGMVSADARRIIASFAELVDDVRIEKETSSDYTISMVMGDRYYEGAAALVPGTGGHDASEGTTTMTLVVRKKDMSIESGVMRSETPTEAGTTSNVTEGTYSDFDSPVDIKPPPEALEAPLVDESEAPETQQY